MAYRAVKASLIAMCIAPVSWANDMQDGETFAAMDGMFFEEVMEMPEVLTAARLRQSQLDTPASVTVIEADTIAALGFKDIEEIFRLVPGMLVGYHSGFGEKAASVSYHGTNAAEFRRLQVVIDGRSVFKPGLARVEWSDIPLAIEDIARIEVIRGPNSASYGANSYLGIVNILTKHPSDESVTTVKIRKGNRGVDDAYVNTSSSFGSTDIRWTVGTKSKSGFVLEDLETDNRDSTKSVYSTVRTFTPFNSKISLDLQLGYKEGENEQRPLLNDFLYYFEDEDVEAIDRFSSAKLNLEYTPQQFAHVNFYTQSFERTQEWNACLRQAVADQLGEPYYCGVIDKNLNERKTEIEYQHTSTWGPSLRSVMGMRVRRDELTSQTYNAGHSDNFNYSVFTNIEYKIFNSLVTNIGGMHEKDDLNGENFSPRVALNYHFTNSQTIRFIYSEAVRSPDLYEMTGQSIYTLRDTVVDGAPADDWVFPIGEADGGLNNEKIYSHEISYFTLINSLGLQFDVKLFYDQLTGLITQSLDLADPLTNDISLVHKGVEGTASWKANRSNQFRLSYAYVETDDDGNLTSGLSEDEIEEIKKLSERQSSLSADHSGSLSWISQLSDSLNLGVAYYHVENWNPTGGSTTFQRVDFNMTYDWQLEGQKLVSLQGSAQHRLDDDPIIYNRNFYKDDTHYYMSLQLKY
jgi:iron complex outermembrane receptor protein